MPSQPGELKVLKDSMADITYAGVRIIFAKALFAWKLILNDVV